MFQVSSCSILSESENLQAGTTTPNHSKLDLAETATLPIVDTPTATAEPTATKEPTVTPTEKPLIEGNIFFDPQSEADFDKVVKSPSPIDNPKEFAVWQDEYLRQINEKLETYEGPDIKFEYSGIGYESGDMVLNSEVWPVVASFRFDWQGKEILTKTYVVSSEKVGLVPVSVTYTTSDSVAFNQGVGYKTPTSKSYMFTRYEWEFVKISLEDNFIDEFLPDRDKTDFFIWRDFMAGISDSIEEDRYIAFRTRFVFSNYQYLR